MEKIMNDIYVTTCGRIFLKNIGRNRTIKSYEYKPSTNSEFNRFIRNNNLKLDDFEVIKCHGRNDGGKLLYTFKYNKFSLDMIELHGCVDSDGYRVVCLSGKNYKFHRLIKFFFEPINNYKNFQINHIDGDKLNNCLSNLEWCTSKGNINHAWKTGLSKRTDELNKRTSKTMLDKLKVDRLFDENFKGQKPNIKLFLKLRGLNFDDYEFVITGRTKTHHALGYLRLKNL